MKIVFPISAVFFISFLSCAGEAAGETFHNRMKDVVAGMKTPETKCEIRTSAGGGGLRVGCTLLPKGEILAMAWEIDNPDRTVLDIKPSNIRVYDQVREFEPLTAERAIELLYGKIPKRQAVPKDPFIDAGTPPSYLVPRLKRKSPEEEAVYSSVFHFNKTDARKVTGITYYERYGDSERVSAEITLSGEAFKFDF